MTDDNESEWAPEFGPHGYIYPAIWRILGWNRFFSPAMWLPRSSTTAIDNLLVAYWLSELLLIVLVWVFTPWNGFLILVPGLLLLLFIWRLVDMLFVHLSILIKGYYRNQSEWVSSSRIVLLTIINAIELMVVYGALYWVVSLLWPSAAAISPPLNGLFDGMYLSVVTATTLGYGTPNPTGWISRLLSMAEAGHLLLIIVAVITYARTTGVRPTDREVDARTGRNTANTDAEQGAAPDR